MRKITAFFLSDNTEFESWDCINKKKISRNNKCLPHFVLGEGEIFVIYAKTPTSQTI